MTLSTLSSTEKKRFRRIGHKLRPIVTIASKGLTEGVLAEVKRSLEDHELIKIKLSVADKQAKKDICVDLCGKCDAQLVQTIGHVVLLFRKNKQPDPNLSNLLR
jgi:RNA-binding protein